MTDNEVEGAEGGGARKKDIYRRIPRCMSKNSGKNSSTGAWSHFNEGHGISLLGNSYPGHLVRQLIPDEFKFKNQKFANEDDFPFQRNSQNQNNFPVHEGSVDAHPDDFILEMSPVDKEDVGKAIRVFSTNKGLELERKLVEKRLRSGKKPKNYIPMKLNLDGVDRTYYFEDYIPSKKEWDKIAPNCLIGDRFTMSDPHSFSITCGHSQRGDYSSDEDTI